jgi:hypothetical protein
MANPRSPTCNLPPDHPLFTFPTDQIELDGNVLAERFARQRALLKAAKRKAEPRRWWQFWRWRKAW